MVLDPPIMLVTGKDRAPVLLLMIDWITRGPRGGDDEGGRGARIGIDGWSVAVIKFLG